MARVKKQQLDEIDMKILENLRKNSRATMTQISEKEKIAVTTIFGRFKFVQKHVKKNSSLINFSNAGFPIRAYITISSKNPQKAIDMLAAKNTVNNLYVCKGKIIVADAIFRSIRDSEKFISSLSALGEICSYYIVEEIIAEEFIPEIFSKITA